MSSSSYYETHTVGQYVSNCGIRYQVSYLHPLYLHLHSCESYIVSQCYCKCGITYFINPPIIPLSPFWEPYSTPIILDSFNTKNLIPNTLYKRVTSRKTQKFATLLACNVNSIITIILSLSHFSPIITGQASRWNCGASLASWADYLESGTERGE